MMNYRWIVRGLLVVLLALILVCFPMSGSATGLMAWAQAASDNGRQPDGTVPMFDLNADWTDSDQFYNFPYPSDLRLDAQGHPDLSGFPSFTGFIGFFKRLKTIASDRPKFPTTAAAYFRFNQPLAPQNPEQLISPEITSPILLIDVDPTSPERGRLIPIVASTPDPDPYYVPPHLLAVAPYPGIVLEPNRQYAYVVRRSLRDASRQGLKTAATFRQLRRERLPKGNLKHKFAAYLLYKPLWQTLDQLGIKRNSVVSATVFTTGDVVTEMAELSDRVLARYYPTITKVKYAPETRISDLRHCKFEAEIKLPDFQKGAAPFLAFEKREGLFEQTATGDLVQFGNSTIPVVITLPKTPMPVGGYPLVAYYHGSGGISSQVVDRGPVYEQGGDRIPGRGPADVVARYGFAAVGSALPVNPERVFKPISNLLNGRAYLNPTNPAAYRDTFRQGVIEQRLLLRSLQDLQIEPAELEDCTGPTLPAGETAFHINPRFTIALGQSQGAQYATMMGAVEPNVKAVVPTGSGGMWSLLFQELANSGDPEFAPIANLLVNTIKKRDRLDHLYPALRLLQSSWEPAESMVYMARIAKNPLPGHPVRSIYQPVGKGDSAFPEPIFDAMALATGVQQAGPELWPEMQQSLALAGLDGIVSYPVANNLVNENGDRYTGVVVQFEGDGLADPHTIFSQLDEVKSQYGCFMDSVKQTKVGKVSQPRPIFLPCGFGE
ncbi:MAG: hypothetical protein F6K30_04125 [Cyanothece sp. SIO2G6]|nr:hypothetical protein [Cyanothece sp. SIO2G6]